MQTSVLSSMESTKQNASQTFQVAGVVSFYMSAALVVSTS